MTCDHDALAASLDAFTAGTIIIGVQPDGDGGWLLLGRCYGCDSSRAIPIAMPRGNAVHGAIEPAEVHQAMQDAPHDGQLYRQARAAIGFAGKVARHLEDLPETMDEHARRVIK